MAFERCGGDGERRTLARSPLRPGPMPASETEEDEEEAPTTFASVHRWSGDRRLLRFRPMKNIVLNSSLCKYAMVRRVAEASGWEEVEEGSESWQVFWTDLSVSHSRVKALTPLQRINHFPDMTRICHKAESAIVLKSLSRYFAAEYHFFPQSWSLPKETAALHAFMADHPTALILKPNRGCQGVDITVVTSMEQLEEARAALGGTAACVVQEYVDRPLLLDGYKFDLRLYVLVTSCVPLRIHIYRDGMARLCTMKYQSAHDRSAGDKSCDKNGDWRFQHLTNYAINKLHPDFSAGEGGTKRRLGDVLDQLSREGCDVALLWGEVQQLVVKTLIAVQPTLAHSYMSCRPGPQTHPFSCFELLGFDLLVDENLKPWLVEVNHSPSLACDTALDADLKRSLLSDTMRMCSFSAAEAQLIRRSARGTSSSGVSRASKVVRGAAADDEDDDSETGGGGGRRAPGTFHRTHHRPPAIVRLAARSAGAAAPSILAGGIPNLGGGLSGAGAAGGFAKFGRRSAGLSRPSSLTSRATASIPGYKDVSDRRRATGALNSELLRLRAEYESACATECATGFELIHPSRNSKLQELYDLLHSTSQRAHAEDCGARVVPPLLMGSAPDSWCSMFKLARRGERIVNCAADPPTAAEYIDRRNAAHDE